MTVHGTSFGENGMNITNLPKDAPFGEAVVAPGLISGISFHMHTCVHPNPHVPPIPRFIYDVVGPEVSPDCLPGWTEVEPHPST